MSFPNKEEIEVPILIELNAMGGEATTGDIYRRVARHLPQIFPEELAQTLKSGDKKWPNLVRWASPSLPLPSKIEAKNGAHIGLWALHRWLSFRFHLNQSY